MSGLSERDGLKRKEQSRKERNESAESTDVPLQKKFKERTSKNLEKLKKTFEKPLDKGERK